MSHIKTAWIISCVSCLILILAPSRPAAQETATEKSPKKLELRIKPLPEGVRKVYLLHTRNPSYLILRKDGREENLSPEEFTLALDRSAADRPPFFRLLNISSKSGVAWVLLGLLGQVLFTGRMVFQWLVSEKARRSIVPVAFWWMSLGGATMLLTYFLWRRDIVGVLGQSTGWFIYSRNLWLIYHKSP